MSATARSLLQMVEELPIDAQMEVRDFVEFLLTKHGRESGKKLRQDWAEALIVKPSGLLKDYDVSPERLAEIRRE